MGIIELIIVVLVILWLVGYFGRGRLYGGGGGSSVAGSGGMATGNLVHILLVIAVILIVLRLLGLV
jgi:Family of unknown function (DUF5670)